MAICVPCIRIDPPGSTERSLEDLENSTLSNNPLQPDATVCSLQLDSDYLDIATKEEIHIRAI